VHGYRYSFHIEVFRGIVSTEKYEYTVPSLASSKETTLVGLMGRESFLRFRNSTLPICLSLILFSHTKGGAWTPSSTPVKDTRIPPDAWNFSFLPTAGLKCLRQPQRTIRTWVQAHNVDEEAEHDTHLCFTINSWWNQRRWRLYEDPKMQLIFGNLAPS